MTTTQDNAPPRCRLVAMDLHDPDQAALLLRQRAACGWASRPEDVARWRQMADAGTKQLWWVLPGDTITDSDSAVGHIGLQSVDLDDDGCADPDSCSADGAVLNLTTFYIDAAHRGRGLGRAAVAAVEAEARARARARAQTGTVTLTIHTTSRRYTEQDGPEWRGSFAARGLPMPARGSATQDWYARMGFVAFQERPRYRDRLLDGTPIQLVAVYMRKILDGSDGDGTV